MTPRRGTYRQFDCIVDWLNGSGLLHPMEQSAYAHWVGIRYLTAIVDRVEQGLTPKFVAMDAIETHNTTNGTAITYEEVRDRYSHNFIFSSEGEWVIYTDLPGLEYLIRGEHDDPAEAMLRAPPTCAWMIIWFPAEREIVVYRSPHVQLRNCYDCQNDDGLHADGLSGGPWPAYTLPPEMEGSALQEDRDYKLAAAPRMARTA